MRRSGQIARSTRADASVMTTMHEQPTEVAEPHADDLLRELTQLRATHAELRDELAGVRRQRDEAISQAQWLVTRVSNAEKAIERLQGELLEERARRSPLPVVDRATDLEAPTAAPESDESSPSLVTVVGALDVDTPPREAVEDEAPVGSDLVHEGAEHREHPHSEPDGPRPVSWAGVSGPWLPPDEPVEGSMAHEFAALTERALAAEAAAAEEAAASAPVVPGMDVLPEPAEPKKSSLLRRRR